MFYYNISSEQMFGGIKVILSEPLAEVKVLHSVFLPRLMFFWKELPSKIYLS